MDITLPKLERANARWKCCYIRSKQEEVEAEADEASRAMQAPMGCDGTCHLAQNGTHAILYGSIHTGAGSA
eukprot:3625667-Amphidinium_carterae.2